jgi:hypothetical protein
MQLFEFSISVFHTHHLHPLLLPTINCFFEGNVCDLKKNHSSLDYRGFMEQDAQIVQSLAL